jgi:hypothetical protein
MSDHDDDSTGDWVVETSEPLWTTAEAAAYLGVPPATLHRWHHVGAVNSAGDPPPRSYKVGRHRKYKPHEVREWLDRQASDLSGDAA